LRRIAIHEGDLLQPPLLLSGDFDLVMANPPFHAAGQATAPADPGRARGQGHGRGAALAGEKQDPPRRPAGAWPERKDGDPAGPPLEKGQEIAEALRPMDQQQQALRPGELQRLVDPAREIRWPLDMAAGAAGIRG